LWGFFFAVITGALGGLISWKVAGLFSEELTTAVRAAAGGISVVVVVPMIIEKLKILLGIQVPLIVW
jgi:hypothetical protein